MKLIQLLPFMDNEEVKDLALQIINEEVTGIKLVVVFPFLASEDLDEIVDTLIEKKDTKSLKHALPFIKRSKVNEIYEAIQSGEIEGIKDTYLLPFLGKKAIKQMVKDLIKEAKENNVSKEDEIDEEDFEEDDE